MAFVVIRDLTIGPKTMTRMQTPERSIVAVRDRWIPHGFDVESLPAKVFATLHSDPGQAGTFPEVRVHITLQQPPSTRVLLRPAPASPCKRSGSGETRPRLLVWPLHPQRQRIAFCRQATV